MSVFLLLRKKERIGFAHKKGAQRKSVPSKEKEKHQNPPKKPEGGKSGRSADKGKKDSEEQ